MQFDLQLYTVRSTTEPITVGSWPFLALATLQLLLSQLITTILHPPAAV